MKFLLVALLLLGAATPSVACSKASDGDYLFSTKDPTLPVLLHHGVFTLCSQVIDPDRGAVLDCGHGALTLRNPDAGGVLWGTRLFVHTDNCPAVPLTKFKKWGWDLQ